MDSNVNLNKNLKIFTLNCWGLRYVSDHRQQRIKLIAQHILEHNYDIVFLQEIWCQSDFDYIRTTTKSKFRFAHMFKNASILGTSGLVILTVWNPNVFHFHPFSVNGSPFRPLHGDWFTSKGVGYTRIELDNLNLHLFCTHMHAQYDLNERINDQYSVHRICQSYETAKFINLMTNCRSGSSKTRDLIILAGDMNASSKELPYRLLVSLTGLNDCLKYKTKVVQKISDSIESGDYLSTERTIYNDIDDGDVSDEDCITCGHRDNTFTPQPINPKTNGGKRIDFILFKLMDKMMTTNGYEYYDNYDQIDGIDSIDCAENSLCKAEHMKICCKDESGLSFSDHQPVVALLNISDLTSMNTSKSDFIKELNCDSQTVILNEDIGADEQNISVVSGNKSDKTFDGYEESIELHENNVLGSLSCGDGSHFQNKINSIDISDKSEEIGLLTGKNKFKSNILLEITENVSKASKTVQRPLQLKQIASNAIKSKVETKVLDKNNLLSNTKSLLENYVIDNRLTQTYCLCLLGLTVVSLSFLVFILLMLIPMTVFEILFLVLIITIITSLSAFLKFLTHRHERNAVNAILNDIKKEILFNN